MYEGNLKQNKNKMTKTELKETLNRYGFQTIEGIKTYYSKAEMDEAGLIHLRVGEWGVIMYKDTTSYKVQSINRIKHPSIKSNGV